MSEYWKSTPKYWCKHCSTYVKDTPFERKQHEATGKHQGSLKRFLRGVEKDHERNERDKQKAKAEVERLNRIVGKSSASPNSELSTLHKSTRAPQSAVDQKRQWAQLAEMGIQVPQEARNELAMPGGWETVSPQKAEEAEQEEPLNKGVRKRKHHGEEGEEDENEETPVAAATGGRPGWGSTTKRYPAQKTTDLDGLLSGKLPLKTEKADIAQSANQGDTKSSLDRLTTPAANLDGNINIEQSPEKLEGDKVTQAGDEGQVKSEPADDEIVNTLTDQKSEMPTIPVFKKRKGKTTGR